MEALKAHERAAIKVGYQRSMGEGAVTFARNRSAKTVAQKGNG